MWTPDPAMKRTNSIPLAPALQRGLDILEDLHGQTDDQSVSSIAERLRLPPNSTLRLLATLEAKGYVERDPGSLKYRLTRKPASLALNGVREQSLLEAALPLMRDLRDTTGETVLLSIIEHGTGIVLEQIQSLHVFRFVCNPGAYHALHAAAPAKAILATLPQVDRSRLLDGYAFTRFTASTITDRKTFEKELLEGVRKGYWEDHAEEFEGICCVAAPVFNRMGCPIAAITVTGPLSRMTIREMATDGARVAECAKSVSRRMGYGLIGSETHGVAAPRLS